MDNTVRQIIGDNTGIFGPAKILEFLAETETYRVVLKDGRRGTAQMAVPHVGELAFGQEVLVAGGSPERLFIVGLLGQNRLGGRSLPLAQGAQVLIAPEGESVSLVSPEGKTLVTYQPEDGQLSVNPDRARPKRPTLTLATPESPVIDLFARSPIPQPWDELS